MAKPKKPAADKTKPADSKPVDSKPEGSGTSKTSAAAKSQPAKPTTPPKPTPAKPAESSSSVTSAASKAGAKTPATKPTTPASAKPEGTAKADAPKTPDATPTAKDAPKPSEATPTPKSTTSTPTAPHSAPVQQERRGGFIPLFLGGVVAAGLGYFAAQNDLFGTLDTTTSDAIAANSGRIDALESAEVDLSAVDALQTRVDDLSGRLADIDSLIAALDERVTAVEARPAPDGGPSIADQSAFEQELQTLKADAEAQRAEVARLLENAQSVEQATAAAAQEAAIQSAVSQITSALVTGAPFPDTLTTLQEADVAVPDALSAVADEGVTTVDSLKERYPDSARAALGAARSSGAMDGESGLGGFLKRQLGARSTLPREGNDPDAILSRAEAQVRTGTVDEALTELDALPKNIQAAMQEWLDDARARAAAAQAIQDLSQSLTAN